MTRRPTEHAARARCIRDDARAVAGAARSLAHVERATVHARIEGPPLDYCASGPLISVVQAEDSEVARLATPQGPTR